MEQKINENQDDLNQNLKQNEIENSINKLQEDHAVVEVTDENDYLLLQDNSDGDLTDFWKIFEEISSLSIPMALSFTFSFEIFLMTVLLNYFSGSENELAATALITTMINTIAVIGMAPIFAMSVVASNKYGELIEAEKNGENEESLSKKREYIAGVNRNGSWLATGLSIPVTLSLIFSKPILTYVFRQNEDVAQITQNFLRTYSPAIFALMHRMSIEQSLFSFRRGKQAMILALASFGIGTLIALWLGMGGLGIPRLGATGIAIGYVVESYLTTLFYGLYLAFNKDFSKFHFFRILKPFEGQIQQFLLIIKLGIPITFSLVSEMLVPLLVSAISGLVGTREQSAISYVNQYLYFNFLLLASFGQTCGQELNRQFGGKKFLNANAMGKYGLLTTLIYTTPLPLLFSISPRLLLVTSKDAAMEAILKYLVPIMSVDAVVDSARYNLRQQLTVLGDANNATIISISGLSLGMVMAALLALKTNLGIYAVAIGYSGGILISFPGLLYRWNSCIKSENMRKSAEKTSQPIFSANSFCGFFKNCFKKTDDVKIEDIETGKILDSHVKKISYEKN